MQTIPALFRALEVVQPGRGQSCRPAKLFERLWQPLRTTAKQSALHLCAMPGFNVLTARSTKDLVELAATTQRTLQPQTCRCACHSLCAVQGAVSIKRASPSPDTHCGRAYVGGSQLLPAGSVDRLGWLRQCCPASQATLPDTQAMLQLGHSCGSQPRPHLWWMSGSDGRTMQAQGKRGCSPQ